MLPGHGRFHRRNCLVQRGMRQQHPQGMLQRVGCRNKPLSRGRAYPFPLRLLVSSRKYYSHHSLPSVPYFKLNISIYQPISRARWIPNFCELDHESLRAHHCAFMYGFYPNALGDLRMSTRLGTTRPSLYILPTSLPPLRLGREYGWTRSLLELSRIWLLTIIFFSSRLVRLLAFFGCPTFIILAAPWGTTTRMRCDFCVCFGASGRLMVLRYPGVFVGLWVGGHFVGES